MKKIEMFSIALTITIVLGVIFLPTVLKHSGSNHALLATYGAAEGGTAGKTLVVYFSRSGNTRAIAKEIRELTGSDIFEIETVDPYPSGYRETTEQAQKELKEDFRPLLRTSKVPGLESYDTVFIGYPIWWGRIPPALMTFLDENDLSGKTMAPFCSHGGSRFGSSVDDLRKLAPGTKILDGLELSGNRVENARKEVKSWLEKLGLQQG